MALVTGGTRGIGAAVCRSWPGSNVVGIGSADLDLSSLADVDRYEVPREVKTLVLCAGVMGITRFLESQRTVDGFDRCFQVNFLSQARMILASPQVTRVVFVSSHAARGVGTRNLIGRFACHSRILSYAASKAAMHGFLEEWASRMPGRSFVCVDPGDVATDIMTPLAQARGPLAWLKRRLRKRLTLIAPEEAARRVVNQVPMERLPIPAKDRAAIYEWVRNPRCAGGLNVDHVILVGATALVLGLMIWLASRLYSFSITTGPQALGAP